MACELCYYYSGYTIESLMRVPLPVFFTLYEKLHKLKADDPRGLH